MNNSNPSSQMARPRRPAWNKGKFTGPKPPLRPGHVWSIRAKLQLERRTRDLAMFILAIDTASCAVAISWRSAWMTWRPTGARSTEQLSARGIPPVRPLRTYRSHTPVAGRLPTRERPKSGALLVPWPASGSIVDDAAIYSAGLPMD